LQPARLKELSRTPQSPEEVEITDVDIFPTAKVCFFESSADYRMAVGADGLKLSVVGLSMKEYPFRAYQGLPSSASKKNQCFRSRRFFLSAGCFRKSPSTAKSGNTLWIIEI
jgi:hypothetical protein